MGGLDGLPQYEGILLQQLDDEIGVLMRAQKAEVGVELLGKCIDLTPVNTGEARKGWHASSGKPSGKNQAGGDALSSVTDALSSAKPMDPLFVQNYVEHVEVIDNGTFRHDTPEGGSPASHVPKSARDTVRGKILVRGGFHVVAPKGISRDAIETVAQQFGLEKIEGDAT